MIVFLTKYYLGDQFKNEIVVICDIYGGDKTGICFGEETPGQKSCFKSILQKSFGRAWTGLKWLRVGTSHGFL
jgi:hypothetical protein